MCVLPGAVPGLLRLTDHCPTLAGGGRGLRPSPPPPPHPRRRRQTRRRGRRPRIRPGPTPWDELRPWRGIQRPKQAKRGLQPEASES